MFSSHSLLHNPSNPLATEPMPHKQGEQLFNEPVPDPAFVEFSRSSSGEEDTNTSAKLAPLNKFELLPELLKSKSVDTESANEPDSVNPGVNKSSILRKPDTIGINTCSDDSDMEDEPFTTPKYTNMLRERVSLARSSSGEDPGNSTRSEPVTSESPNKSSLRSKSVNIKLVNKLNAGATNKQERLSIRDLQRLMREGRDTLECESYLNKEDLLQLTHEELAQKFLVQQEKSVHVVSILNEGLRLFAAGRNVSPLFFKEEVSPRPVSYFDVPRGVSDEGVNTCQQFLSEDQIQSLKNLIVADTPSDILLLVDDTLTAMKFLLRPVISVISSEHKQMSKQLVMSVPEWQNRGFIIERINQCNIICAANGRVALEIIKKIPITAMITDHEMPEMEGLDLSTEVRNRERLMSLPRMPIALHTTREKESLDSTQLKNIDRFISKNDAAQIREFLDFIKHPEEAVFSSPGAFL